MLLLKLGIVVNVVGTASAVGETTYRLALDAVRRGHEVWILAAGDFSCEPDGRLLVRAASAPARRYAGVEAYVHAIADRGAKRSRFEVSELDVLLLRSNPSVQSPWAQRASLQFGVLAAQSGVIVLNDPLGLERAANKLYLDGFPADVRPRTLVTRRFERVASAAREWGHVVLKPLQGSGGRGVFIVRPGDAANLEAIYRALARDGYVIVQEYLEAATAGDTRVFLLNGRPLRLKGRFAAVRRVPSGTDPRSNVHVGAHAERATVGDSILRVAEAAGERLVADGMFFVGLDIVGDKLMEVNVFSPGGLGNAQSFEQADFTSEVVDAIERKLELRGRGLDNAVIATRD